MFSLYRFYSLFLGHNYHTIRRWTACSSTLAGDDRLSNNYKVQLMVTESSAKVVITLFLPNLLHFFRLTYYCNFSHLFPLLLLPLHRIKCIPVAPKNQPATTCGFISCNLHIVDCNFWKVSNYPLLFFFFIALPWITLRPKRTRALAPACSFTTSIATAG